jgi:hypothetical protein
MDLVTDKLNKTISSEMSDAWKAIPGGLDKVSPSSQGFAWGIGSGKVWSCRLPCTGNWTPVDIEGTPVDIATDDSNVYVLLTGMGSQLAFKSASNTTEWIIVPAKTGITGIFLTSSYIWGQGPIKWRLAKPGTTANWVEIRDSKNITITSTSLTSIYGVDSDGNPVMTDESMQSGWSVIPEVGGKYNSVIGGMDETAIYGVDKEDQIQKCSNGDCSRISTKGFVPQALTVEPVSKQLWMTATTSGDLGNIFSKNESPDYSSILQTTRPFENEREKIVEDSEKQFEESTNATSLSRQLKMIRQFFMDLFGKPEKVGDVRKNLFMVNSRIEQLRITLPLVQKLILLVAMTSSVYLFSGILDTYTNFVALAVLASGVLFLALNNGV